MLHEEHVSKIHHAELAFPRLVLHDDPLRLRKDARPVQAKSYLTMPFTAILRYGSSLVRLPKGRFMLHGSPRPVQH